MKHRHLAIKNHNHMPQHNKTSSTMAWLAWRTQRHPLHPDIAQYINNNINMQIIQPSSSMLSIQPSSSTLIRHCQYKRQLLSASSSSRVQSNIPSSIGQPQQQQLQRHQQQKQQPPPEIQRYVAIVPAAVNQMLTMTDLL